MIRLMWRRGVATYCPSCPLLGGHMRKTAILLASVALAGCTSTNPGSGVQIRYKMPRTDGRVAMSLDVTQCESAPGVNDVEVAATLKIEVVAGTGKELYQIQGARLASDVIKRGLTIDRDADTGVITGINASATDQRSVILANIISFAAKAVAFAAAPRGARGYQLVCTAATKSTVDELTRLKADMVRQRKAMATAADAKPFVDAMNADAARIVVLKEMLHRDVTGKIEIPPDLYAQPAAEAKDHADAGLVMREDVVVFDWTPLDHLLTSVPFGGAPSITGPTLTDGTLPAEKGATDDLRVSVSYRKPTEIIREGFGWTRAPRRTLTNCSLWVNVPAPLPVTLVVTPQGHLFGDAPNDGRATVQPVMAAQLSDPATVCLSAAFGENRSVGLKFDKFGTTTEMAWASDARGGNIAAAIGGSAGDAFGIATTLRGSSLADEKRQLDVLQTSQGLRKAQACQELLDQGATKCD